MKRAVLYMRVSTAEQSIHNQLAPLEKFAKARGWTVVARCSEIVSGVSAKRPALARVLELARRREIDVVAIWALDRLGRSMDDVVRIVLELGRLNVELVSLNDPWLDVGPQLRPLLLSIFAWIAEQFRTRLVEQTNAGLARARARGVRLGRPARIAPVHFPKLLQLRADGMSLRQIAMSMKVPEPSVRRALKRAAAR